MSVNRLTVRFTLKVKVLNVTTVKSLCTWQRKVRVLAGGSPAEFPMLLHNEVFSSYKVWNRARTRKRAVGKLVEGDPRMRRMRRTHESTKIATALPLEVMRLQNNEGHVSICAMPSYLGIQVNI